MVQGDIVKGRVLVCADGATSKLATKLGYCTEPPEGICSRAYVKGGTHNAKFDGAGSRTLTPLHPIRRLLMSAIVFRRVLLSKRDASGLLCHFPTS